MTNYIDLNTLANVSAHPSESHTHVRGAFDFLAGFKFLNVSESEDCGFWYFK